MPMRSLRERSSPLVPEPLPFCQQSATILFMCSILLGLRIFLLTLEDRNPWECFESSCQNCMCLVEVENSIVHSISVSEVLIGSVRMPLTSRAAWQATQLEHPHLKWIHTHLSQCTWPSKKPPRREMLLLGCYLCCWRTSCCTRPPSFTASSQTGSCPSFQSCSLLSAILIVFSRPFIDLSTKESVFFSSRPQQGNGLCVFLMSHLSLLKDHPLTSLTTFNLRCPSSHCHFFCGEWKARRPQQCYHSPLLSATWPVRWRRDGVCGSCPWLLCPDQRQSTHLLWHNPGCQA